MCGIPGWALQAIVPEEEIDISKSSWWFISQRFVGGVQRPLTSWFIDKVAANLVGLRCGLPTFIGCSGGDASDVYSANEYLTRINLMKAYRKRRHDLTLKVLLVWRRRVCGRRRECQARERRGSLCIVYRRSGKDRCRLGEDCHARKGEEGRCFSSQTAPLGCFLAGTSSVTRRCRQMELGGRGCQASPSIPVERRGLCSIWTHYRGNQHQPEPRSNAPRQVWIPPPRAASW